MVRVCIVGCVIFKLFLHLAQTGTKDDRFIKDVDKIFYSDFDLVPSTPSNLIGFPTSETSIYLNWLHPRNPNGILTHNTIYFRLVFYFTFLSLFSSPTYDDRCKKRIDFCFTYFVKKHIDTNTFCYVQDD